MFENEQVVNGQIQKEAPCMEQCIFEKMPSFLQRILVVMHNERERDMLLLASLANLSVELPNVHFSYSDKRSGLQLYTMLIAKPGSGKGMASMRELFLEDIEKPKAKEKPQRMKGILRMKQAFQKMTTSFSYTEWIVTAEKCGLPKSIDKRCLQKLV